MRIIGDCMSIVIISSLILWTVYDVHCVFLSSNATTYLHVHVNTCFCGIYHVLHKAYICLEAIEILKGYNNKEYNEDNMVKAWNYILKLEMAQKFPFRQTSYVTVPPNVAGWRRVALQMAPFAERIQTARDPCCEKAIMLDATSCKR